MLVARLQVNGRWVMQPGGYALIIEVLQQSVPLRVLNYNLAWAGASVQSCDSRGER